ncbi:MAG TPA: YibE/F family protein [Clostridiales bacterium]|nr:YibE/F family protein [Clostridiales bacterium]
MRILKCKRRSLTVFLLILVIFIAEFIFMNHNYFLYSTTVAKVKKVTDTYLNSEEGVSGEEEKYYQQSLLMEIKNGPYKGRSIFVENTYSVSQIDSTRYRIHEDVFLNINATGDEITAGISGKKRDQYLVYMVTLLLIIMIVLAGRQGLLTLASLAVNITVFIVCINRYVKGTDYGKISFIMIMIFSVITLLILGGFTKKSLGAILSTLLTVLVIDALYRFIIYIETPPYELMDYMVGPADLSKIFTSGIIIGCLGAVMDVAITINSAVHEIVVKSRNITFKVLVKSIREIGHDIMGTMINVLLFTYISGSLPIILIKLRNGYTLENLVRFNIIFEIIRFLVGSIGIVLAVPISGLIAVLIMKVWRNKNSCC